ncbi:MAG: carbohydrate kinase [Bacteroidales bacterium]|nr:carbohydrate kinase [Bacteroidales bacterium]
MSKPIIYAAGETVFDIIFKDYQPRAAKPGGSAFNAMITLGRLDIPASFISEVGNDRIGKYIKEFLKENGVENEYVVMFDNGKSAISLAFLNERSDAEYEFYKDYPNQRLNEEMPEFSSVDYFLFGSFYGLNPVLRPQIKKLLNCATQNSALVYYDPNFRSSHLDDLEQLKSIIEENLSYSTLVRASDEDMENIYKVSSANEAWDIVSNMCKYFIYTANAHGVDLFTPEFQLHIDVERIEPVSTIGAGDTFNAGVLYGLYRNNIISSNIQSVSKGQWTEILKTAASFSREVCLSYDNYLGKR